MSEKEFTKDGNLAQVSEDNVEAQTSSSESDPGEPEEAQEVGRQPVGSESRDSGHDSPLEGAVGGELENGVVLETLNKNFLNAGKADLFRRFFNDQYTQVKGPTLDRHQHETLIQRQRHLSDGSLAQSGSSPLGLFKLNDSSSDLVLNQAGAIIGKKVPTTELELFKNENGQALSGFGQIDSEQSIGSVETALISDVYAGNFSSRPPSDDSRGLSPGLTFPSFSPQPPTAALDDLKANDPLPDSESSVGCRLSPTPADSQTVEHEKPARQRRIGVTQLVPVRSKSALAGCSVDTGYSLLKRKISKDLSVCSEPLPERKISKDSSVDSGERISSEDEAINYPELAHSEESDSCLPMPDLVQVSSENLKEDLQVSSSTVSEIKPDVVDKNIEQNTEDSENVEDPVSVQSCSPDVQISQQPPSV